MRSRERWLILLLCLAAALRVFVYAAAFPFFSNGDEDLHFDLVTQYAGGRLPRTFDVLKSESMDFISLYCSPEFLQGPDAFPDGRFPGPLWKQPAAEAAPIIEITRAAWQREVNWESSQPPLYYAVAGCWWRMGQLVGLRGIESLYWIRFLNAPLIFLVVWLGYLTSRMVAPEHLGLRLGVPLLLAFMPQDVFYVMSNDVLSPVCFGAVFLCLLRWWQADPPWRRLAVLTGLAVGATYLTKLSNLPLLTIALLAVLTKFMATMRRQPRAAALALVIMVICAGIPILSWMVWSQLHFTGITGSGPTVALLGWTRKPLAEWWHHPIFSVRGLWVFWSEVMARFWRGELMWHNLEFQSDAADHFYIISSLLFLCLALARIQRAADSLAMPPALWLAFFSFLAAVAFLALLSVQFDFGQCVYPSRDHPYFTSGRLISGALIPFALCYVYGVTRLWRGAGEVALTLGMVALIALLAVASEIAIKRDVFASEHNWYHLP